MYIPFKKNKQNFLVAKKPLKLVNWKIKKNVQLRCAIRYVRVKLDDWDDYKSLYSAAASQAHPHRQWGIIKHSRTAIQPQIKSNKPSLVFSWAKPCSPSNPWCSTTSTYLIQLQSTNCRLFISCHKHSRWCLFLTVCAWTQHLIHRWVDVQTHKHSEVS